MSETVTFFDLPSKGRCHCWSLNPWKTRLLLNYKGIPYKTEWVEYPHIAGKFKDFGIPPHKEGMAYTIPAARLPFHDPQYVMDSAALRVALDAHKPTPPIHLDSPVLPRVEDQLGKILMSMGAILMPRVPTNILNEVSAVYFNETREKRFGMPLEQLGREKGGEDAWKAAAPELKAMADVLKEKPDGPFFLGKDVSYADFVFAGFLQFARCTGEDVFQRVVDVDPVFGEFYKACGTWLERDDH